MGLDTKTYWLTDRQSQYDFDFDLTRYNNCNRTSLAENSLKFNYDKSINCSHENEKRTCSMVPSLDDLIVIRKNPP
jgi:hypothetical protein